MNATDQQKLDHIRLARSRSIGPVAFQNLVEQFGTAADAIAALLDGPQSAKVCPPGVAEAELNASTKMGATLLCLGYAGYPERLAATPGAPPLLYYKGDATLFDRPAAAMVGSRNASGGGLKLARSLAGDLGAAGLVIVSGLARGIDAAAHSAALDTGTIACLAGGLDVIYPQENRILYKDILARGLLTSEMPPGTMPQARHFPRRNRIISGLSDGVIILEAAARSGSLITARFAAEQGRDLFAIPGSPLDPRSAGANQLLKDGAILVRSAQDVLDELRPAAPMLDLPQQAARRSAHEQKPEKRPDPVKQSGDLLTLLSPAPIHTDEIVGLSGRSADSIIAELQMLELEGKVVRHSGSRFSRIE